MFAVVNKLKEISIPANVNALIKALVVSVFVYSLKVETHDLTPLV